MKIKLLLFLFLGFISSAVFAGQYRGGEITFKIIGPLQLEATLTIYLTTDSINNNDDRDSIQFDWGDATTSFMPRINGDTCNQNEYPCGVIIASSIKQNIYKGTHTYSGPPDSPNIYYIIKFYDENRMGGIANIAGGNSIQVPFFIEDSVYMPADLSEIGLNSSPILTVPPAYFANVCDTFVFNSTAYDADGDSITYKLIPPKQDQNDNVPLYIYHDAYCNGSGNCTGLIYNSCTVDSLTGKITWATPCQQGFYNVGILTREYHCGFMIGSVERDLQIIVLNANNDNPQLSFLKDTVIQPGQLLQFSVTASDTNSLDTITLKSFGGPFLASQDTPVFSSVAGNPASGSFSWQPGENWVRHEPYLFSIIAQNDDLQEGNQGLTAYPLINTKSFRVWVGDTASNCIATGIYQIVDNSFEVHVFPNPAVDMIHLNSNGLISSIEVTDIAGRPIREIKADSNTLDINISGLDDGIYILRSTIAGKKVCSKFLKMN